MGKKVRIIVSILVIVIIGILVVPPQDNSNEPITTVYESDFVSSDDINMDQVIIDQAIQEYSIVETNRVFTESNDSLITRFLDEQGIDTPLSAEKLGIEVQTVLFDSDQNQYPSSTIIGIPELSVYDEQGRVLDLGTIQTSFLAISANTEKYFNLDGTVEFYLDDDLISTKRIYVSDTNTQKHELSIVDSLPNTSFDRPKAFTFTISDEGRNWKNESEHTYRVVLTQVNAQADSKSFSWNGENIVYELKVKVDESKKVILDENNSAIQIFKNDNTLQLCGVSTNEEIRYQGWQVKKANPPDVIIRSADGLIILDVSFEPELPEVKFSGKHAFDRIFSKSSCSEIFTGIPRGADLTLEYRFEGKEKNSFQVTTSSSQKNYYVNSEFTDTTTNIPINITKENASNCERINLLIDNEPDELIEQRISGNYIWNVLVPNDKDERKSVCEGDITVLR